LDISPTHDSKSSEKALDHYLTKIIPEEEGSLEVKKMEVDLIFFPK